MTIMQKLKTLIFSFIIGITFAGGITFASWATNVWHDPDTWISNGATISAQKIAENFEYLKARIVSLDSDIKVSAKNSMNIVLNTEWQDVATVIINTVNDDVIHVYGQASVHVPYADGSHLFLRAVINNTDIGIYSRESTHYTRAASMSLVGSWVPPVSGAYTVKLQARRDYNGGGPHTIYAGYGQVMASNN